MTTTSNNMNGNSSTTSSGGGGDVEIIGPYQIGRTIGQGIFAKVKLGEDEFRQKVAIKIFDKSLLSRSPHQLNQVEKELNALRCCSHPHIVQFYEVLETDQKVYLVMEHLPHGELYDYILDKQRLSEEEGGRLFTQVVSAVQHCHQRGLVHRDLKPENILLTDTLQIKLVDFGLANYFDTNVDITTRALSTQCGSPHYAAPEILTGSKYSGPLADIWSLGVLLFAMLCGSLPFNARSVPLLIKKIVEGKFKFPKFLSPSSRHLISSILQIQPELRPPIDEILKHPWMQQWVGHSGAAATGDHPPLPPLHRPLSRPEIISTDNVRPNPVDLHRLHIIQQRKNQDEILPPANSLAFSQSDMDAQILPPTPTTPLSSNNPTGSPTSTPSNSSILSQNALPPSVSNQLHRKPIACQFCHKALTPRVNDSGDFLLNVNVKDEETTVYSDGSVISSSADVSNTHELCNCLRSRQALTDSPTLGVKSISSPFSPTGQLRSGSSDDAESFQRASLRENYFHQDDPHRKSKLLQDKPPPVQLTAEEAAAIKKAETIRALNEAQFLRGCEEGDAETVSKLIEPPVDENGLSLGPPLVDVRAKGIDNLTGLHYAARNGHVNVIQALLSSLQPLDINCRSKSGWSAMMLAADQGHIEVVKLLVKYGAAIHITNNDGKSAIFLARESGHHEIAQVLTTASSNRHKRHSLLSSHNTNRDGTDDGGERSLNYELFRACEFGDISKVSHLLRLSSNQAAPVAISRRAGQDGASEDSANKQQSTRYSVDITARGIDHWTALHFAARKGRAAVIELLLAQNPPAPINATTKNGWTALMMASDKGFADVCRLLLTHGADPNVTALDGTTALKLATEGGFQSIADDIVDASAKKSQTAT